MTAPVIVIGSGGHAKVLIAALQQGGAEIIGMTDRDPGRAGERVLEVPVLGDDAVVNDYDPAAIRLVNGVGSTGDGGPRRLIFERFRAQGYRFAAVVHPAAIVAADAALGEGAQIMAGAVVQPGCWIGANAIVNTRASIDHDCRIGDHVHVAPGAVLCGGVTVGDRAHVGAGATVIQNVRIGAGSLIGAGAVVAAAVPEGGRVGGGR